MGRSTCWTSRVRTPGGGSLRFSVITTKAGEVAIQPGVGEPLVELHLCLLSGTKAGTYPLEVLSGELVDDETRLPIVPRLGGGTVTVLEDVGPSDCLLFLGDLSQQDKVHLDLQFKLGDATGKPGDEVTVPFAVKTNSGALTHGLDFSVAFDHQLLEVVGVETVLARPDGKPWFLELPYLDNELGTVAGRYLFADYPWVENVRFPVDQEFQALQLKFRIKAGAATGTTDVRFQEGATVCSKDVFCKTCPQDPICKAQGRNRIISGQAPLSPELVDSFVFVGARIGIVPDGTVFVRGDSSGDGAVDLNDAVYSLAYLFQGGETPGCLEAADANDDGALRSEEHTS